MRIIVSYAILAINCCLAQDKPKLHSTNSIALVDAFPLAKARFLELAEAGGVNVGGFGGFGVVPSAFLELSVIFIEAGDRSLFDSYLTNKNPTIQAMGLACLSQADTNGFEAAWRKVKDDGQPLTVWLGMCIPVGMTLGELAAKLKENRNFLGHADDYWDFQEFRQAVRKGSVPETL